MFEFYVIGVVLSCIFAMINYLGYLLDNNIKHPHWLFYANEIFWNLLIIGGLSWLGFLVCVISIGNRFANKL
jgi:hypothetical protein